MRLDFSELATFTCFYVLLKRVKLLANSSSKGNVKGREKLAEVQFVI